MSLEMYDYFSPVGQKFAERYHAKWSGVINAQVPLWYNATKILFEAMRRAGSIDVDKVRDAVPLTEGYDAGVVGPVVWGGMKNYGVNKQLLVPTWIAEVKDGKEVIITKITPEKH
jgi:branched-chain amino acid transport system substrate-binding protein